MTSGLEGSVCYQNRPENHGTTNDLFKNIRLNNQRNIDDGEEVEQGFRNLDSTLRGRIRNATILVQEKCTLHNRNLSTQIANNVINILLVLCLIVLFILACYKLVNCTFEEKFILLLY